MSYSAAVALQLAVDASERVHSLTLMEPPSVHVPGAPDSRAASKRLQDTRRTHGVAVALEAFLALVIGAGWRGDSKRAVQGSVAQMQRDAATFFDADIPALLAWRFGAADARRVTCPVLYAGGTDSGPWFAEVRQLMCSWLPQTEDVLISAAGHSLATTHPADVAADLAPFYGDSRSVVCEAIQPRIHLREADQDLAGRRRA